MCDARLGLLVAMYLESRVVADDLTAAAMNSGQGLGLSDPEIYELLESLADDHYIERDKPLRDRVGRVAAYRVSRITPLGIYRALSHIRHHD